MICNSTCWWQLCITHCRYPSLLLHMWSTYTLDFTLSVSNRLDTESPRPSGRLLFAPEVVLRRVGSRSLVCVCVCVCQCIRRCGLRNRQGYYCTCTCIMLHIICKATYSYMYTVYTFTCIHTRAYYVRVCAIVHYTSCKNRPFKLKSVSNSWSCNYSR